MSRSAEEDLKVVDTFWPEWTEEELRLALPFWPEVGDLVEVIRPGGRPLTSSALIRTTTGQWFVKRRHPMTRPWEALVAEHAMVEHLRENGIPTPALARTAEGGTAKELNGSLVEIQALADGDDLYLGRHTWQPFLKRAHAVEVGRMLRRIHTVLASYAASEPVEHWGIPSAAFGLACADDLAGTIMAKPGLAEFLASRPEWQKELESISPSLERVRDWGATTPRQRIHGDPQANNHLFEGDQVASVIDFHLATEAPALVDLAIAIDRNGLLWLEILGDRPDAYDLDGIAGLLEGYGPLTAEERNVLPDLLAVCQVDFALDLMSYYMTLEQSLPRATWCWEAYLLAHTHWHASDHGQRFRQQLIALLED